MKHKSLIHIFLLSSAFVLYVAPAKAQNDIPSASLFDPQTAADKSSSREDELYNEGTEALDNGEYPNAAGKFDQVARLKGRKADAAIYWKAYALNKAGNKEQSLTTIAELKKSYPQSKWLRDAGALELEVRSASGQKTDPNSISDEELKLLAIQSLMNSDPEKAVPSLEKIVHGNYSPKLKDKALFVLSQSGSEKAEQIMLGLAKDSSQPDMQKRAIRYIGMSGSTRNRGALKQIYDSSTDPSVKKSFFQAWLMSGDKESVLAVAHTEKSPELRRDAIRHLGMMGGTAELRQLYKESNDADTKEAIMQGMGMSGDVQGLTEAATSEKDPAIRSKAIRSLGIYGGENATPTLVNLYNTNSDLGTKKEVVNALFLHGSGKEMVALARKETNPEMKKELIHKMSLMGSPEISDYMMEILNK